MQFTAPRTASLFELMQEQLPDSPKQRIRNLLKHATLLANGKPLANPSVVVQEGSKVEIRKGSAPAASGQAPFPVHYEDKHLLIVEKPAGLLTVNQSKTPETSLYKEVFDWLRAKTGGGERPWIVHRLDREVGGLVIFAKSEGVQQLLKDNWRQVEKRYYALVHGAPPAREGSIRTWLWEAPNQLVKVVKGPQEGAKEAITHYQLVEQYKAHSLLDLQLETGRKNQLRVHLAHLGCPIAGDWRYGAPKVEGRPIHLLAYSLRLPHPQSGKTIALELPLPRQFMKVVGKG
ncbi:RluA family pseudouridine synthase [Cesiribacter andamanensis]|uniref:Ribosomal large subunit pseudouridine synthase D n=1 Tax=Cesiribacter andamanensis AMV16 TaxID=1279009 RepID=M7N0D0_9BACT|nr:RluA family pseudouridine synthase [Cesiribacter andamanensis]EMR00676.1 Ribosomal large subunit pseudouridine synthase D [Cesiribacter andamanensis AMV16]